MKKSPLPTQKHDLTHNMVIYPPPRVGRQVYFLVFFDLYNLYFLYFLRFKKYKKYKAKGNGKNRGF